MLISVNIIYRGEYVNSDTIIGEAGHSGTSATHLHLEFPCATKEGDNYQGERSYAPSLFYYYVTYPSNWGLNTSFINHIKNNTVVEFRISSMDCGRVVDIPQEKVNFIYRVRDGHYGGWTIWNSCRMHKNGNIFTIDVKNDLGLYGSFDIEYYISAMTNSFDGVYRGPAYRPYRYDFSAPTDRPFMQSYYISSSVKLLSSNSAQYCNPEKTYETPPILQKDSVSIPIVIKKKSVSGYVCYNESKGLFTLSKLHLNPYVIDFIMKNHLEFYASVSGSENPGFYKITDDGYNGISIVENGMFIKKIKPDLFVFKTDKGVKLFISRAEKFGVNEKYILNKSHMRISCVPTNKMRDKIPIFEYSAGKAIGND